MKNKTPARGKRRMRDSNFAQRPRLLSITRLLNETSEQSYVVGELVPDRSTIGFIGAAEALKSTTAVDITGSVAFEIPWHGRPVKGGAVLIIAGEGHTGLSTRLRAWAKHHKVKLRGAPIFITKGGMQLSDLKKTKRLVRRVARRLAKAGLELRLIIVDPVARSFAPGDENNAADMCRYIENIDWMRQELDCSVILVHHTGHSDKTRARGSSAFRAALDLEVAFTRRGAGVHVRCMKSKDAPPFPDMQFELKEVRLPRAPSGAQQKSIVLKPTKRQLTSGSAPVKQDAVLELLRELIGKRGRTKRCPRSSDTLRAVPVGLWREIAVKKRKIVATDDGFDKLKRKLVKRRRVTILDGHASVR